MAKSKKQTNSNKSNHTFFWIVVVMAVAVLALIIYLGGKSDSPTKDTAKVDIDYSQQPFVGDKKAPVNIIEFGDYKCPICKDFNDGVYPVIQKELVDTGLAKFYFINYPFINVDSTRAAQFAEAVYQELGSDVFWEFHHLLYKNQPKDEYEDYFTESVLKDLLASITDDSNIKKVTKAFNKKSYKKALDEDESLVSKLGVDSTPTLFINGEKFSGKTYDDFINQVKDEAKK